MTRRLRIKCPACQAALEVAGSSQPQIEVQCPKCGKRIIAKVTAASRPQSTATGGPLAPQDDLWSMPLGLHDLPLGPQASFPTAIHGGHYAAPTRTRVNHKLWLWPTAIVLCLALAVPAVWFGGRFLFSLAETDWSTFSLIPDSHQRLTSEYLVNAEQTFSWSLAADASNADSKAKAIAHVKRDGRLYGQMILRAVKLPKGNLTDKASFQEKFKAIAENYRDQAIAKAKAAFEKSRQENQPPNQRGGLSAEDLENPEIRDALLVSSAVPVYLLHGIWDLPAPENEVERIYYEEADVVREFLKSLGRIHSKRQANKAHVAIEAQADRVLELAVRRSQLPRSFLERVPREYVDIDKAFSAAQGVLVRRIERDYELGEDLKDALANFGTARECIARASSGTSDSVLQKSFADARALRAKTISRSKKESAGDKERALVVKPRPAAPAIDEELSLPMPSSSSASSSSAPGSASGSTASQPAEQSRSAAAGPKASPEANAQANAQASGNAAPAPGDRDSGPAFSGKPQEDTSNAGQPFGFPRRLAPFGPPTDSDRFEPRFGGSPRRPSFGPGDNASGQSEPRSFESRLDSFNGPDAVIINIANVTFDLNATVKQLSDKLSVKEYLSRSTNGKGVIALRYSGPLEQVVDLIDFGSIVSVDDARRVIDVRGE